MDRYQDVSWRGGGTGWSAGRRGQVLRWTTAAEGTGVQAQGSAALHLVRATTTITNSSADSNVCCPHAVAVAVPILPLHVKCTQATNVVSQAILAAQNQ